LPPLLDAKRWQPYPVPTVEYEEEEEVQNRAAPEACRSNRVTTKAENFTSFAHHPRLRKKKKITRGVIKVDACALQAKQCALIVPVPSLAVGVVVRHDVTTVGVGGGALGVFF
jgi:hypothetical protein